MGNAVYWVCTALAVFMVVAGVSSIFISHVGIGGPLLFDFVVAAICYLVGVKARSLLQRRQTNARNRA